MARLKTSSMAMALPSRDEMKDMARSPSRSRPIRTGASTHKRKKKAPHAHIDLDTALCLQWIVHDVERKGLIRRSDGRDAIVNELGIPPPKGQGHYHQHDASRGRFHPYHHAVRSTSVARRTFSLPTSSEHLIVRLLDVRKDGQVGSVIKPQLATETALLMAYLRRGGQSLQPAYGSPASGFVETFSRASSTGFSSLTRTVSTKISAVPIPDLIKLSDVYTDGLRSPWLLMRHPGGQRLCDVLQDETGKTRASLQERCQLAKAMARLQASIWSVQGVPGWGSLAIDTSTGTLKLSTDSLSITSDPAQWPSTSAILSQRTESIWSSQNDAEQVPSLVSPSTMSMSTSPTRSITSYARSHSRTSTSTSSTTPGTAIQDEGSGTGPLRVSQTLLQAAAKLDERVEDPVLGLVLGGLRRQLHLCTSSADPSPSQTTVQGWSHRLQKLIEAAELLLRPAKQADERCFDRWRRRSDKWCDDDDESQEGDEGDEGESAPRFVLSLPQLDAHNIFVDKVARTAQAASLQPHVQSRRLDFQHARGAPSSIPVYPPTSTSTSWTVTGLLEVDEAEGAPMPLAYLSVLSPTSVWAQMLWERPSASPTTTSSTSSAATTLARARDDGDHTRAGESPPSKRRYHAQRLHATTPVRDAFPRTWAPSTSTAEPSTDLAPNHENDADLGFEFDEPSYEVEERLRRKMPSHQGQQRLDGPPIQVATPPPLARPAPNRTPHKHEPEQEQEGQDAIVRTAFLTELASLVPTFSDVCHRGLASKLPELSRLAAARVPFSSSSSTSASATSGEEGSRYVVGGAEWLADERTVLAAAAEARARRSTPSQQQVQQQPQQVPWIASWIASANERQRRQLRL